MTHMRTVVLLPTAKGAATPLDLFMRVGEAHHGRTPHTEAPHTEGRVRVRRAITDHALRNEKMRASFETLQSVRGVPRAPAAHLSPRVRNSSRNP